MSSQGYPAVPEMLTDAQDTSVAAKEHRRKMALAINNINRGKFNCTLDVLITASAATTNIVDPRISVFSAITPATAFNAGGASDIAAGIYVTNLLNGSATLNHRNAAGVRTIRFNILG